MKQSVEFAFRAEFALPILRLAHDVKPRTSGKGVGSILLTILSCTEYRPVFDHRALGRYSLPTPWAVSFPMVLVGLSRTALLLS
jgi:hypothetical protein